MGRFVRFACLAAWLFVACVIITGCHTATRRVETLQSGWRFSMRADAEARSMNFDDSAWATVQVPHDWAITGPFDPNENGYAGKLPWRGVGWYRKTFRLDEADRGRRVYFDFDGVMAFPKVYVNGRPAGEWDYGYMSFRVDATSYVNFGATNVIAVQADTRRHGTRWYPGAGIYRKVTMTICDSVHVAHWGTYVTTPRVDDEGAQVRVRTTVENHDGTVETVVLDTRIVGPGGDEHVLRPITGEIQAEGAREFDQTYVLKSFDRWDIESPKLYRVEATVRRNGRVCDTHASTFGIRTFEFTADDGFHLNGRRVQLYGVNLHHDQGPLGAAFYRRAMERQLEVMRDMGCNAIRTSHNSPSPELLELCDRMGFLVWNECFDKWAATADRVNGELLEEYGEKQIRNFVLRDRNHPSVVLWSIGNEIGNQPQLKEGKSPERVRFMSDFVRRYDPTRPVGMGCHIPGTVDRPILNALDLTGWNYGRRYARYRQRYPDKPILYSESASALSTRGFYEVPLPEKKTQYSEQLQVSSYDLNSARWSDIPDLEFQLMEDDRFVAGEFVWTGFDYLGEPTPFNREARSSYFGIVDLCGIPKDRFYLYRSHWRPETTTVHILPHWNWPDRVGRNVPVFVYTNGDSAELFLNGISLGVRKKSVRESGFPPTESRNAYYDVLDRYRLCWDDVIYAPGELQAVAYKGGERIGEAVVRTAGPPARIRLTPDRTRLQANGRDLSYVLVEALDADGTLCPLAETLIHFAVTGPARIAGVGNGNPLSLEPFVADYRKLFFGKAMLILRSCDGRPGSIQVTAAAEDLSSATVHLTSVACD